ncbi:MAG: rhodanese-like domain-containing protein [Gammaproteobacteria bacterium]
MNTPEGKETPTTLIFEQVSSGPCLSYLLGCEETGSAIVIDPEISKIDRYLALATRHGLNIQYTFDTHTHADHFSASQEISEQLGSAVIMHRSSAAPFIDIRVDDGETIIVGKLRLSVLHTPGHTWDSVCLLLQDRILTGDTLLIGGTGRTDLPTGDPEELYDSLFNKVLKLDPGLLVYPAHDYRGNTHSTLGHEIAHNPRLQKKQRDEFVAQMQALDLDMPKHLTEALRTNRSGGKTVSQLISDATKKVSFMSLAEVNRRLNGNEGSIKLLDVREWEAYETGHIPGALHIARGQLELRVNNTLPDPTERIVVYCDYGMISTLAAATLRELGYTRAIAMDGGVSAWQKAGYPLKSNTT